MFSFISNVNNRNTNNNNRIVPFNINNENQNIRAFQQINRSMFNNVVNNHIIRNRIQNNLSENNVNSSQMELRESDSRFKNINIIDNNNNRIILLNNEIKPNMINASVTSEMVRNINKKCPICYKNIEYNSYAQLECKHEFCVECVIKHSREKNNCPLCRKKIILDENIIPDSKSKYELLYQNYILKNEECKKYEKTLKDITEFLNNNNLERVKETLCDLNFIDTFITYYNSDENNDEDSIEDLESTLNDENNNYDIENFDNETSDMENLDIINELINNNEILNILNNTNNDSEGTLNFDSVNILEIHNND